MRRESQPGAGSFERNLARVVRRLWIAHAVYAAAGGVAFGTLLHVVGFGVAAGWASGIPAAAVLGATVRRRTRRAIRTRPSGPW